MVHDWPADAAMSQGRAALEGPRPDFDAARDAFLRTAKADAYAKEPWMALADLEYRRWIADGMPAGPGLRDRLAVVFQGAVSPPRDPNGLPVQRLRNELLHRVLELRGDAFDSETAAPSPAGSARRGHGGGAALPDQYQAPRRTGGHRGGTGPNQPGGSRSPRGAAARRRDPARRQEAERRDPSPAPRIPPRLGGAGEVGIRCVRHRRRRRAGDERILLKSFRGTPARSGWPGPRCSTARTLGRARLSSARRPWGGVRPGPRGRCHENSVAGSGKEPRAGFAAPGSSRTAHSADMI